MSDKSKVLVYEEQVEFPGDEENSRIAEGYKPEIKRIQNTRINIVEILEDRLELILTKFVAAKKSWAIAKFAFGIFMSILPLFIVSDFSNKFIFTADIWKIIYLVALFLSGGLLCVYGIKSVFSRSTRSVSGCMNEIKNKEK